MKYLLLILLLPITAHAGRESLQSDLEELNNTNDKISGLESVILHDTYDPVLHKLYLPGCRITQDSLEHIETKRGGVYATDIACTKGVAFDVKAPNISNSYTITEIGVDKLLGNYVVISRSTYKMVFGHTETKLKVGDIVVQGEIIGNTNISGVSTAIHVHVELWRGEDNIRFDMETINPHSDKILRYRNRKDDGWFYFTHYHLGDVNQNDNSPCHGASGKDLCKLLASGYQSIAFTLDKRRAYGISLGDKVSLECKDPKASGVYYVEDEMNKRYRQKNCVLRDGYCIKGDIATFAGDYPKSGICKINKL